MKFNRFTYLVPCLLFQGCSAPPQADEISSRSFQHHFIARDMPGENDWGFGISGLADFDRDGDLDYAVGNRDDKIYWFENQGAGAWARHDLGPFSPSHLGSDVMDVDGDGWPDLITGGYWYRNSQRPADEAFTRYHYDAQLEGQIHDIVHADMDGDGRQDVVAMGDRDGCFWYSIPADPLTDVDWRRETISLTVRTHRQGIHSGFFPGGVADLDGDGDADLVLPDRWYENGGDGKQWSEHRLAFGSRGLWNLSSRSWVADLDGDGDADIVMADSDQQNSGVAWLENDGEKPPQFEVHYLANRAPGTRGSFHSLAVADFEADGDPDILVIEQEDPTIPPVGAGPRWFVWENTGGRPPRFEERVILDAALGGHDARVGDVDGDGDLDIVSKVWKRWPSNANGGRFHADFLEWKTTENGAASKRRDQPAGSRGGRSPTTKE